MRIFNFKTILISVAFVGVSIFSFKIGINLNRNSFENTKKTLEVRGRIDSSPVTINDRSIANLTINNVYVMQNGTLVTEATGKDVMTGATVGIRYASPPSVLLDEDGHALDILQEDGGLP